MDCDAENMEKTFAIGSCECKKKGGNVSSSSARQEFAEYRRYGGCLSLGATA